MEDRGVGGIRRGDRTKRARGRPCNVGWGEAMNDLGGSEFGLLGRNDHIEILNEKEGGT